MAEPATTGVQQDVMSRPWDKRAEENDLWYARFVRFVALGPGRSVSLVAMGRRNAYPVPAHWPMQAKQLMWRERAAAFDAAARSDPKLVNEFNLLIGVLQSSAPNGEGPKLQGLCYQKPPPDEAYEDDDLPSTAAR